MKNQLLSCDEWVNSTLEIPVHSLYLKVYCSQNLQPSPKQSDPNEPYHMTFIWLDILFLDIIFINMDYVSY